MFPEAKDQVEYHIPQVVVNTDIQHCIVCNINSVSELQVSLQYSIPSWDTVLITAQFKFVGPQQSILLSSCKLYSAVSSYNHIAHCNSAYS